jgi:hypothetical protein
MGIEINQILKKFKKFNRNNFGMYEIHLVGYPISKGCEIDE